LLRQSDPLAGAEFLEDGLKRFPHDAAIQQAFAESAAVAGRRDRALEACRAARADHPNRAWACRLEASICLDLGRPTQALEALAPIKADLPRDAGGMELYIRAACAVGAEASAHELLAREPGDAAEAAGHAGAARGYLLAGRDDDSIRLARRIIDRYPEHLAARLVLAEALRLRAEAGDPVHWPVDRVREAIEAFDWLRRRDPTNCVIAQRIAWLQLKGLEAADLALQSAAPLREQAAIARLTPEMNETLGATLLAAGQIETAVPPLTAAIESAPHRAGPYISRAAALLRLGRKLEARADLDRAENLSRTPRQTAEWEQVLRKLRGDS
jgi:predicted Zn-dependent protease